MSNAANEQNFVKIVPQHRRGKYIITTLFGVVVVTIGISAYILHESKIRVRNIAAENKVQMTVLQNKLAAEITTGNSRAIINDTTSLINGKQSGKYQFDNKTLAEYYLDAGTAYYKLKDYSKAINSYKAAPRYDNADEKAGLEGEVSAGYAMGKRQQLLPLLHQLANLSTKQRNVFSSPERYEYEIKAIQQNRSIDP